MPAIQVLPRLLKLVGSEVIIRKSPTSERLRVLNKAKQMAQTFFLRHPVLFMMSVDMTKAAVPNSVANCDVLDSVAKRHNKKVKQIKKRLYPDKAAKLQIKAAPENIAREFSVLYPPI
ncbi:hypothetical protein CVS29_01630 [Arthrobacter psychrochitiniphilus]|uniref:Uncharacterized protein n=1 Tax=Arthrobacter psychrochitiniphilus TaxID=291045 RepID=A0A2V3DV97_9MICC|nr:hypothetical protein CVS29_01630 [Arthrobacter psychrochitiniphilus]